MEGESKPNRGRGRAPMADYWCWPWKCCMNSIACSMGYPIKTGPVKTICGVPEGLDRVRSCALRKVGWPAAVAATGGTAGHAGVDNRLLGAWPGLSGPFSSRVDMEAKPPPPIILLWLKGHLPGFLFGVPGSCMDEGICTGAGGGDSGRSRPSPGYEAES